MRSRLRAEALSDGNGWCGVMGCVRRWADARACEAAAIARHGAVDLAVVPSTICRQCTRVVGECAGSRHPAPLILVCVRVLGCGLDSHVARNALYMRMLFDLHGVDGRVRGWCRMWI